MKVIYDVLQKLFGKKKYSTMKRSVLFFSFSWKLLTAIFWGENSRENSLGRTRKLHSAKLR